MDEATMLALSAWQRPRDGNDPTGRYLDRLAIRTRDRIVIVATNSIVRIDAEGNYVRLWTDRSWLHKETLTGLCARLDPHEFLRVHRSHAVNVRAVRELRPLVHGEFRIRLADGNELVSGRAYRDSIRAMLRSLTAPQSDF